MRAAKDGNTGKAQAFEPMDPFSIAEYEDKYFDNIDNEDYDLQCEHVRQENQRYLDEFRADLSEAGLKEKTIRSHVDNVDFYLNTYLVRLAPLHMRAGCYKIDDYLGDFFIRKCVWSTPASIDSNATSIKKFYKAMLDHEWIAKEDFDYLLATIADEKGYWQELCAEYNDTGSDNPFLPLPPVDLQDEEDDSWSDFPEGDSVEGDAPDDGAPMEGDAAGGESLAGGGLPDDESSEGSPRADYDGKELTITLEGASEQLGLEYEIFNMSDDEILAVLAGLGVETTREEIEGIIRKSTREHEVLEELCDNAGIELDEAGENLGVVAIGELWDRWMPDEPSETTAFACITDGYWCPDDDWRDRLEVWAEAWEAVKRMVSLKGKSVIEDDALCDPERSLSTWMLDYERELERAADEDSSLEAELERFCCERDAIL